MKAGEMSIPPEFSRIATINRLKPGAGPVVIGPYAAKEAEREAVAERLGLQALHQLSFEAELDAADLPETYRVSGALSARYAAICVVSGEIFDAQIDEPFDVRVQRRPAPSEAGHTEYEVEQSDPDSFDLAEDGSIDVGEVVVQSLALALPAYPRAPDSDLESAVGSKTKRKDLTLGVSEEAAARGAEADNGREAGEETKTNPFAILSALRSNDG